MNRPGDPDLNSIVLAILRVSASITGPGDGVIEGDQNLGLLAGEEAVREDVALEAVQVAEADAVAFQALLTKARRDALMG